MADKHSVEGSGTSVVCGESSESTVELNIKTLDSQIYTFNVDKNMLVSQFKEKIASEIGLPVGQQRLIFRGKVLKDEHPLSEYHVESGHTLHLVARQPSQSQLSSGTTSSEETNANNNRGQDASTGAPRNRIGQITHSVVLGTLNVGDQGEGGPDLSRVIGAVLNSFGIGSQATPNGTGTSQPNVQAPQGNGTEGTRNNDGIQNQAGSRAQSGQAFPNQSLPQNFQMPQGAAIPVPSLNAPIPDSLDTLSEFMSRMELALSQNGYQPNQSPPSRGDLPRVQLPSNSRGFSTPESLSTVLRHAQRLLSDRAVTALSHISGRLEQEGGSTDPTVRGQIQAESMQVGLAMQHFGALFLELGRTILTLRMGQSPAESYVNSGPAVYISPSGPNPMMVQPFPLQTSSLFASSVAAPTLNPGTIGPIGIGNVPRHVNIHIHTAVGTRATNGEGMQGERVSGTRSDDPGQTRVLPPRNIFAAAVPSQISVSNALQPADSVSQPTADPVSLSAAIAEVSSRLRGLVDNMQSDTQVLSDQLELSTAQNPSVESGASNEVSSLLRDLAVNGAGAGADPSLFSCVPEMEGQKPSNNEGTEGVVNTNEVPSSSSAGGSHSCSGGENALKSVNNSECATRSGNGNDNPEGASAVPLGLGLGGLQPKRRTRQARSRNSNSDGGTSSASQHPNQQTGTNGQQVLQSLASLANRRNANTLPSGQMPPALGQTMGSVPLGGQSAGGQIDAANVMSQVIQSPALNGLLAGVSQQTGVGSPDVLRNMLEQLTQSPEMRNTVNQIAQQVDSQDLGNMFSGFGMGQGGGFDLSRMVQQMMPIVSQALSGGSVASQPTTIMGPESQYNERRQIRDEDNDHNSQIDLQQVVQRIQNQNPPREIFQGIVENAVQLFDNGTGAEDLLDELCSEGLASEYLEMLHDDVRKRLQGETGSAEKL
ncbi:ubiquitin-like domain-containing protein CIP73 [Cornus florida]|uniref:ubiquitin-like domain-containing protein CIP73 n=1 Tax=Cornus florida TaxID=4283 RepID=UPI00289B8249|nr:ubiquitin-like domain-containing protein CIP73 [Cornus florida]XP_059633835.1 ubiquitin-like domain-containing protein CIP73 [Cornus florida]